MSQQRLQVDELRREGWEVGRQTSSGYDESKRNSEMVITANERPIYATCLGSRQRVLNHNGVLRLPAMSIGDADVVRDGNSAGSKLYGGKGA